MDLKIAFSENNETKRLADISNCSKLNLDKSCFDLLDQSLPRDARYEDDAVELLRCEAKFFTKLEIERIFFESGRRYSEARKCLYEILTPHLPDDFDMTDVDPLKPLLPVGRIHNFEIVNGHHCIEHEGRLIRILKHHLPQRGKTFDIEELHPVLAAEIVAMDFSF